MSIKTTIPVHDGSVDAGLTRHTLPPMQGYQRGVLLIRVTNKAADGNLGLALAELVNPTDADGWLVEGVSVTSSATTFEWRLEVSLPAVHYEVHTNRIASAADAEITFIAL